MVGPSKILTVSYGTFSCTLEGFDNPFSTMRGIAEYFRDLAADDRYFGAEPPIPDAETLHRIAQGDAHKRVVAHVEDGNVTLRQVDEDPVPGITPAPELVSPAEAPFNDPFVDEPADTVALNEPSQVETESVAAKLARIRAVVSHDNVATDQADAQVDEVFATSPISAAFENTGRDFSDVAEAAPEVAAKVEAEPEVEVVEVGPEVAAEPEVEAELEADAGAEADTGSAEPEAEADSTETSPDDEPGDDTGDFADPAQEPAQAETDETQAGDDADPRADEAAIAQFMGDSTGETADDAQAETDDAEATDEPDGSSISRVVKMRRSDFDAARQGDAADGQSVENIGQTPDDVIDDDSGSDDDSDAEDGSVSTLSPEDEAELMANLENVQRKAEAEERAEKEGRALMETQDIEASAESVSRILEVTNTELEESEGSRRRSAIAHLKAAVAATRADKFLSSKREKEEEDELNQYRNDLAKVVKPRRPADGRKSARQAPLMLVSEQRVDEPAKEITGDGSSVQPRRISTGTLTTGDDDSASDDDTGDNIFLENNSFAQFAQDMGAHELPDLLEAAAAYSAYIEGRAHFSRPQIMRAVAEVQQEKFTREEGLRSFGLLLRRGKIKKLKRGQFTVADTTRFHPQPRAVGE